MSGHSHQSDTHGGPTLPPPGKVLVAMSGGVDSSVTAALLLEAGFEVVGCFMRNGAIDSFERDDEPISCDPARKNRQGCCSVNDAADARLVAALLGVPFYVMNFKKDFGRIMDYFAAEYDAGRTPNPCVRCNDWLKFGRLMEYADSIDARYVATGHYARVERDRYRGYRGARLLRGVDGHKDQSYVLFGTKRDRLDRMILPIGNYHKADVRAMAEQRGLPVHDKPDSYEICFVPDNDYRGFLRQRRPDAFAPGAMVDTAGGVIGEHDGHQNFTVGQRRKLGVTREHPLYVISKDAATNTVTLGEHDALYSRGLRADQTNWLIDTPAPAPGAPMRVHVKTHSNATPVPAAVWASGDDTLEVRFDKPHRAVSPGQAVVCYHGDEVIGGGWIAEAVD